LTNRKQKEAKEKFHWREVYVGWELREKGKYALKGTREGNAKKSKKN